MKFYIFKIVVLFLFFNFNTASYSQSNTKVSTIEFVKVLNNNKAEAVYYYQNNWKVLREMAIKKGYIDSYKLLEIPNSKDESFQIMLITTYADQEQFKHSEERFAVLIKEKGKLELLNEKKTGEFRETVYSKDSITHF